MRHNDYRRLFLACEHAKVDLSVAVEVSKRSVFTNLRVLGHIFPGRTPELRIPLTLSCAG